VWAVVHIRGGRPQAGPGPGRCPAVLPSVAGVPRLRRPRSPVHLLRQGTAGLLAVLALVLALRPAAAEHAAEAPADVAVVVAATDLAAGAVLTAADLGLVTLPATAAPDGVVADTGQLAGEVLAGPLRRGEPVTDVRVVGPGLWSRVPSGQVAAPVRLADLAVAALLRPGDRVDVLAIPADTGAAEMVAARALVLSAPPAVRPGAGVAGGDGGLLDGGLLVLAVSAETAARLAGSATSSTLTVTLGPP
jgi:pilus assembly protein CpaB